MSVRPPLAALAPALMLALACGGDGGTRVGGLAVGVVDSPTVDADFHTLRTPPLADGEFELLTLSTMPDAVTGGDVLVAIRGLAPGAEYSVTRNGDDVTAAFTQLENGEVRGLVAGLDEGVNALIASSGGRFAGLAVRN
ncbi:MAG: DUF6351 family protein, partial [Candidatus Binatia bacterium]